MSNFYQHKPEQEYQLKSHPPDRLLKDHLSRVGKGCRIRAGNLLDKEKISTTICHKDLIRTAYLIGACHDIGKGTVFFQEYLLNPEAKIDPWLKSHAMISSIYCSWVIQNDPNISDAHRKFLALAAAIVIQGHHGSLKSRAKYVNNLNYFRENKIFSKQIDSFKNFEQEIETITTVDLGLKSFKEFCLSNTEDWQDYLHDFVRNIAKKLTLTFSEKMEPYFIINMLYSTLLDTDNFDAAELQPPSRPQLDLNIARTYVGKNFSQPTNEIDRLRNILFEHVDKQQSLFNLTDNRIFTLTAPTGLGKTLTSINFALNLRKRIELVKNYKPRIIYVGPFLSILDQNMEVLQKVFLADSNTNKNENTNLLLMHHHLAPINYHDDSFKKEGYNTSQSELLIHGWNAEVIVTTFIQFFNMVFGRYTSQLRRLVNTIGSIVILDEVQSIPYDLWDIVRNGLLFLSKKYSFTIILMTATQPIIFRESETIEIAATNEEIKAIPPRVSFVLRDEHEITLDEFCKEMNDLVAKYQDKNILIELNTIYTAKQCFDNLQSKNHEIRFLSSQVIPKHRRPRINEIKKILSDKSNKKVILVSTQVIEAGVDLDFNVAVRDIGPIDSIVQTAGRCNREGRRDAEESPFFVYRIIDNRDKYRREHAQYVYGSVAIEITRSILNSARQIPDIANLVDKYNKEIIDCRSNLTSDEIYNHVSELNYEEVAKKFLLIDEDEYKSPVFVEFDDDATRIWKKFVGILINNDKNKRRNRTAEYIELRNQMGQYMIDVPEKQIQAANLQEINGIYQINRKDIDIRYDEEKGFVT
jgi:CRISPR-associated endonuclease/helicase Cas3